MDEIEELKRAIGPAAQSYSDTQLQRLSREIDLMADFLLDLYTHKRSGEPEGNARCRLTEPHPSVG